ncbi:hypothetical protein [Mesorhizobium sp. M0598]
MRSIIFGLVLLLPAAALAEPIETQKIITAATGTATAPPIWR